MFHELHKEMQEQTLFDLLGRLSHDGYLIAEAGHSQAISDNDLEEAWECYYEDSAKCVNLLETMHGFIFEQEHTIESSVGMKDWNRIVATAKDLLKEQDNEVDAAMDRLSKVFTFLPPLEIRQAVEQAADELAAEPEKEQEIDDEF